MQSRAKLLLLGDSGLELRALRPAWPSVMPMMLVMVVVVVVVVVAMAMVRVLKEITKPQEAKAGVGREGNEIQRSWF